MDPRQLRRVEYPPAIALEFFQDLQRTCETFTRSGHASPPATSGNCYKYIALRDRKYFVLCPLGPELLNEPDLRVVFPGEQCAAQGVICPRESCKLTPCRSGARERQGV